MPPSNPFSKILEKRVTFSVRSILYLGLLAFSACYLIWEIYWYKKVGFAAIKWHSHIMLYVYLLIFGYLLLELAKLRQKKVGQLLFSVWVCLFCMEMLLMLWGNYRTYSERNGWGYQSPYRVSSSSYYHVGEKELTISRQEFTYTYPLNSLGFPDSEWLLPDSSRKERRILSLGDSFTFGDGAPYRESYVSRLDKLLNKDVDNKSYYLMNAGFCGSDPFFNYVNLRDRLWPYAPDVVVQTLASQDFFEDYAVRGGMQRFLADEKLQFKPAPWWEPLYVISDIVRAGINMAGYNNLLLHKNELKSLNEEGVMSELVDFLQEYVRLCHEHGIVCCIVIRPDCEEVMKNKYRFDFSAIRTFLEKQKGVYVYDLLPYYTAYTSSSQTDIKDYFWKKDGHHNPAGYQMMAEGIDKALVPILDGLPKREK